MHAPHWYDGLTLMRKTFLPWLTVDPRTRRFQLGRQRVRDCLADQVAEVLRQASQRLGGAPTLIGETGIPFDMQGRRAYRTGDFSMQVAALDATLSAMERNFASFALWNYTADNTNAHGDHWNGEDFSIFSRDQQQGTGEPDDGGRALAAFVRPYAARLPGRPLSQSFDLRTKTYRLSFRPDPAVKAPLVVFLPAYHYPHGVQVTGTPGEARQDQAGQWLEFLPQVVEGDCAIEVRPV